MDFYKRFLSSSGSLSYIVRFLCVVVGGSGSSWSLAIFGHRSRWSSRDFFIAIGHCR